MEYIPTLQKTEYRRVEIHLDCCKLSFLENKRKSKMSK